MKLKTSRIDSYIAGAPLAATAFAAAGFSKLESKKATQPIGYIGNRACWVLVPFVSFPLVVYSFLKEVFAKIIASSTNKKKFSQHATREFYRNNSRIYVTMKMIPTIKKVFQNNKTFKDVGQTYKLAFQAEDLHYKQQTANNPLRAVREVLGGVQQQVAVQVQNGAEALRNLVPNPVQQ